MKSVTQGNERGKNIFCAIDLHDESMLAGFAVDKGAINYRTFNTRENSGVRSLLKELEKLGGAHPGGSIRVAYEASGSGFRLSDVLEEHGFRCIVLAPSHLPVSQKSRSAKTDKNDVNRIMDVVRGHVLAGSKLVEVWKPSAQVRDDRELVRRRVELGEEVTRVKNQIHGLLKRNGIERPAQMNLWTDPFLQWLDRKSQEVPAGCGSALSSLVRELRFYLAEKSCLDKELDRLSQEERYCSQVSSLTSVKGVAVLTAMVFLTELGDLGRFRNRKALGSYLGLTPRSYESGEHSDRKGHISRLGPSRLRRILNQAAWSAVQWDPYWSSWFRSRTEIEGLSAKKKKDLRKKMITAVMRRLGIQLWHLGLNAVSF